MLHFGSEHVGLACQFPGLRVSPPDLALLLFVQNGAIVSHPVWSVCQTWEMLENAFQKTLGVIGGSHPDNHQGSYFLTG